METIHHQIPEKARKHHHYGLVLLGFGGGSLLISIGLFWTLQTGIFYWIMMLIKKI